MQGSNRIYHLLQILWVYIVIFARKQMAFTAQNVSSVKTAGGWQACFVNVNAVEHAWRADQMVAQMWGIINLWLPPTGPVDPTHPGAR